MGGEIFTKDNKCAGLVSKNFTHYFSVSYSKIFGRYFSHDLKDQIEMEYKLRKTITGESL